jgi:protein-S-isoprenylcysteine O-methyltransferase Ste14
MTKNKVIEVSTYIGVVSAIWVLSPALGKFIDSFYFHYPHILADSVPTLFAGSCVVLMGTILSLWTIVLFKTKGQGTPNPKLPPKNFVISGPYRFSRNPMASGGFLTLMGEAIVYYSPSLFGISILFGIILYFYVRFFEEPELKKRFGVQYEDYLRRVPRFIPQPWKWYRD